MPPDKLETGRAGNRRTADEWFSGEPSRTPLRKRRRRFAPDVIGICFVMLLSACATTYRGPAPFDDTTLRDRATTIAGDGIRVSGAIPSTEESRTVFGIDLEKHGIQPLWLEIENITDRLIFFLPTGLDPEHYSPLEVAFGYHASFSDDANAQLDDHIQSLSLRLVIGPHSKESGFVYTYREDGNKFVIVDLVGRQWSKSFTLVVPTPDRRIGKDYYERISQRIARSDLVETEDESQLRELLEQLPCCTSSKEGVQGEPLNIVLIGQLQDLVPAFLRRNYRITPATPRYLFQRPQDVSIGKRDRWVAAQPHVMRAWLTAIRFRGNPVWIVQISTPLGGRFASATDVVPLPQPISSTRAPAGTPRPSTAASTRACRSWWMAANTPSRW